jgi:hypothetical protein
MFATRYLSEPVAADESLAAGRRLWTIADGFLKAKGKTN